MRFSPARPRERKRSPSPARPASGRRRFGKPASTSLPRHGWRVLAARPAGVEASLSFAGLGRPLHTTLTTRHSTCCRRPSAACSRGGTPPRRSRRRAHRSSAHSRQRPRPALHDLRSRGAALIAVDDAQWLDTAKCERAPLRASARRGRTHSRPCPCPHRRGAAGTPSRRRSPKSQREEVRLRPLTIASLHEVIRARLGHSLPRPTIVKILEQHRGQHVLRARDRSGAHSNGGRLARGASGSCKRARPGTRDASPTPTRNARRASPRVGGGGSDDSRRTQWRVQGPRWKSASCASTMQTASTSSIHYSLPRSTSPHPPSRRRAAHRRLVDSSSDPETRARHLALAAAEPDESARGRALDAAATHTAGRGASAAAAELARLALQATPAEAHEARARRTISLAHHLRTPANRRRRARSWMCSTHRSVGRRPSGGAPARPGLQPLVRGRARIGLPPRARGAPARARSRAGGAHAPAAAWLWHDPRPGPGDRTRRCRSRATRCRPTPGALLLVAPSRRVPSPPQRPGRRRGGLPSW